MAVIVEDGSGVAGANSYQIRADYIAYALTLGITITDDDTADNQLVKAAQYIDSKEATLIGYKVEREQAMGYPRYNLWIDGESWQSDEVPIQAIKAQREYALDVNSGVDLFNRPQNPNLITTKERVEGAIDVEYAVPENVAQNTSRTSMGDAYLSALVENAGQGSIPLVRV